MKTPIYEWHKKHGQVIDFSGWLLPVSFSSIAEEHNMVRKSAGLFDVSNMCRIEISGEHSQDLLDTLVTRDMSALKEKKCGYTFILNSNGGFHDDIVVQKISDNHFYVVCNAGNESKILAHLLDHAKMLKVFGLDSPKVENISRKVAMIALQGPKLHEALDNIGWSGGAKPWTLNQGTLAGKDVMMTGTGYTGEIGVEIYIPYSKDKEVIVIWEEILEKNKGIVAPCGLGARDSLRLEAGYVLYGNDIDEDRKLWETQLDRPPFFHANKQNAYIGKYAIKEDLEDNISRVAIILEDKGVLRSGFTIHDNEGERKVGQLTSGAYSPSIDSWIGMGYVEKTEGNFGEQVQINMRGKMRKAKIDKFPVYKK